MIVTRITGDCPGCKSQASFGNVFVHCQILTRGCWHCNYQKEFFLPSLSKTVIYLDQFFLSHAFREQLPEFVDCVKSISSLAHNQLVVCPISSVHEDETHQWRHDLQKELWEFVKKISRGHTFEPVYHIRHEQIVKSFTQFLTKESINIPIDRSDVLPDDINDWENYFRVEVERKPDDIELMRKLKEESVAGLVDLFPKWRESETSFQDHLAYELRMAGEGYIDLYLNMLKRMVSGDFMARIDSPIDSMIVESMLNCIEQPMESSEQGTILRSYFQSDYFANVPYESISVGLVTVLRERVREGQFPNAEKAIAKLKGFFFDLQFIAAYAPYCDAMFIDTAMHSLVNDKLLNLEGKFGTKFFSKSNWEEFIIFLDTISKRKTKELINAVELVYPI